MVSTANLKKVVNIINNVKNKFPHLEQVLERVGHLAESE